MTPLTAGNNRYCEKLKKICLHSGVVIYAENNMDHNSSPNPITTVNTKSLKQY